MDDSVPEHQRENQSVNMEDIVVLICDEDVTKQCLDYIFRVSVMAKQ